VHFDYKKKILLYNIQLYNIHRSIRKIIQNKKRNIKSNDGKRHYYLLTKRSTFKEDQLLRALTLNPEVLGSNPSRNGNFPNFSIPV
jgi:hypothetical protein